MNVKLYHKYSELDKEHQFGIEAESEIVLAWVFYHLGFLGIDSKKIWIAPFKGYDMKLIYTYKTNGCDKIARFIFKKINKIIRK